MCGIVGYIGKNDALGYLLNSLKVLEYRGYDSSGVAIYAPKEKKIKIVKSKGKLNNLIKLTDDTPLHGTLGIGHTRWATQGIPSDINAHPHVNGNSSVAIVHNGIISNYLEIKEDLIKNHRVEFTSDTDSEVIAHLVGAALDEGATLREAMMQLIKRLKGSYAISVIYKNEPDKIMLACNEAPIVIGIGKQGELFCASDSAALLQYTDKIVRLKDSQIAELSSDGEFYIIDSKTGAIVTPIVQTLTCDPVLMEKGGFKHFLLKEINEQPAIIRKLINHHLSAELDINFKLFSKEQLLKFERIMILGCGTAFYAGMTGKILLETLAKIPCDIEFSSEAISRPILADEKTLVIAISQSGETADTLLAVKSALAQGAKLLAVTNRPESSLAALAEGMNIFTQAGIEVSVAATKSFTAQIVCLYLFAFYLAEIKGTVSKDKLKWMKQEIRYVPTMMEQVIARSASYREKILPYANKKAFIFLGRGLNYPIALEGALKLKELTYIQSTGYASGEMKHGPIATIDQEVPTLSIISPGALYHKTLHNAIETKTRGAPSIAIVTDSDKETEKELDVLFRVPDMPFSDEYPESTDLFSPFVSVIPLQLIAYYLAEYLGKDVDQPRNLAKSVTVE
jgi:glucosamine--fructose-6-phosphate aminotransferase (isomerizing)